MATWKKMLEEAFAQTGDSFGAMVSTMTDEEMNEEFYDGFGGSEGCSFTAWGEAFVYFPVVYDGAEYVGWAPRNPCDIATGHWGGE